MFLAVKKISTHCTCSKVIDEKYRQSVYSDVCYFAVNIPLVFHNCIHFRSAAPAPTPAPSKPFRRLRLRLRPKCVGSGGSGSGSASLPLRVSDFLFHGKIECRGTQKCPRTTKMTILLDLYQRLFIETCSNKKRSSMRRSRHNMQFSLFEVQP